MLEVKKPCQWPGASDSEEIRPDLLVRDLDHRGIFIWRAGHARRHLVHYLTGHGHSLALDLTELLSQEHRIRERVNETVRDMVDDGAFCGSIKIRMQDYHKNDWRLALGSFSLNWNMVAPGVVRLSP